MWWDRGSNLRHPEYQSDGTYDWPSEPGMFICILPMDIIKLTRILDIKKSCRVQILCEQKVWKWAATWQNQQSECAPSEDSDQPGHPPSLIRVFTVRMKKPWVLSYPLSAQRRLIRLGGCPGWSESSLGAHSFCWFCHVVAQILLQLCWMVHRHFPENCYERLQGLKHNPCSKR